MSKETGFKLSLHHIYLPFFYFAFLSIVMLSTSTYLLSKSDKTPQRIYASESEQSDIIYKVDNINPILCPNSETKIELKEPISTEKAMKINKFFASYGSPLQGYGKKFVEEAEKNNIEWKLVAAIAHCESTGGKVTPQYGNKESYNAWGWAVYDNNDTTRNVNRYSMGSWENGIEIVSAGMKSYYAKDLDEPEEIVTRYTPASVRKAGGDPAKAPWTLCMLDTYNKIEAQDIEFTDLNNRL